MKTCSRCQLAKAREGFYADKSSPDGLRSYCKVCHRSAVMRSYYRDHEASKARKAAYRSGQLADRYRELDEMKSVPCADCDGRFPAICMDFDHVRGEKIGNISMMVHQRVAWDLVVAEVAKCDVVCANCHRIRTAERAGWKKRVI